jgi:hypothetical protein
MDPMTVSDGRILGLEEKVSFLEREVEQVHEELQSLGKLLRTLAKRLDRQERSREASLGQDAPDDTE